MNFSLYIARRYLVSKNGRNAINIINILSFIITIIGTTALFIVLSGFSGLKDFSTSFSSYFDPDLRVSSYEGKSVEVPLSRKRDLQQIPGVEAVSLTIEEKVFLSYEDKNEIAFIKGVDESFSQIIPTDSILLYGTWLTDSDMQIVAGSAIASKLSLTVSNYGSFLQVMVPKPGRGAINELNINRAFISMDMVATGIFTVNVESIDSKYIFTRLDAAQNLLNYPEEKATAVEIKLLPTANEDKVREEIEKLFDEQVVIKNKYQMNDALYKMLNSENLAVYLIFTLVLIIALFNVVGSIIMMILDKKKNLKTLLDLGAEVTTLRKVFFIQGSLMTVTGGIIGIVIGTFFVYSQIEYQYIYIAPGIPYPFALQWENFVISFMTIAVLGIIASYIGSRRINDRLLAQAKL
ncbi:ABC transporter permease [Nonlabens spongiae]|uniref:ABC transporter permease n=1 Tax=Nonlabens spongiae TaxID=331648 RepID=A0A1W6MLF3_9FLAO|nr:FtsX-like permease family protein [Nonlabens spongiae]ARN78431.1 ABC transporter permease [Nonlabens spongiae]